MSLIASIRRTCLSLAVALAVPSATSAFHVGSTIDPAIVASPVEVIIWVKDGVTPQDEARVLAQIQEALQMWEDIPTSAIAFDVMSVIHSTTDPGRLPHQLKIIVGNRLDLSSGGASLPSGGNPGIWFGAVADNPELELVPVAAHEIGHAIGFLHSTLSEEYPIEQRPIMHYKIASPVLLRDDIAAASVAYPVAGAPQTTGTVRGRLVVPGNGSPITGVNVVAMDDASGLPAVARLSGANGSPGTFDLPFLPPGSYELLLLDGESYRGSVLGLGGGIQMDGGYQADNFADFSAGAVNVSSGNDLDLGDIEVTLFGISIEGFHEGPIGSFEPSISLKPLGPGPPDAFVGQPYEIWLQIRGGLRDLTVSVSGLPEGLTGGYAPDPRVPNVGVHGRQFVRVVGTLMAAGDFSIVMDVQDALGQQAQFVVGLEARFACGGDVDADGVGDCSDDCLDLDADGYGIAGGAGNSCLGSDCAEGEPNTYPGAPEVNDALDNQCPGDPGFGLVDETSGQSRFEINGGLTVFDWTDQAGATSYEVVRSPTSDLSSGCGSFNMPSSSLTDTQSPPMGVVFHYLNRSATPNPGTWGLSSAGERLGICP